MARRSTPRERRKVLDALDAPEQFREPVAMPSKPAAKAPVRYSEELGLRICKDLAGGMTLNQVCKQDGMPTEVSVREWAMNPDHPFSTNYVRAREIGFVKMADDLLAIVDDGTNDWMERAGKDGEIVRTLDREHIARSELRFRARQWLLSKALPKIYGDKIAVTREVDDVSQLSDADIAEELARRERARATLAAGGSETTLPHQSDRLVH